MRQSKITWINNKGDLQMIASCNGTKKECLFCLSGNTFCLTEVNQYFCALSPLYKCSEYIQRKLLNMKPF